MAGDGFAEDFSIIADTVALCPERTYVHPLVSRRQIGQIGRERSRQRREWRSFEDLSCLGRRTHIRIAKSIRESVDFVTLCSTCDLTLALIILREHGHAITDDVLHVDLSLRVFLVADNYSRTGYILHASVLGPKLVRERRLDGDRAGDVHETWTNKCESGGALTDGCHALSFEGGGQGGELRT